MAQAPDFYGHQFVQIILGDPVAIGYSRAAYDKAHALLLENLTPEQRADDAALGWFKVEGGMTGWHYSVRSKGDNPHGNNIRVDSGPHKGAGFCLFPQGVPTGDVALTLKFWIEHLELKVWTRGYDDERMMPPGFKVAMLKKKDAIGLPAPVGKLGYLPDLWRSAADDVNVW